MDSGQRERNPWRPKAAGGGRTRSLLLHDKCCPVQVKLQWGCESLVLSLHLHFVVLTSQASWGRSWGGLDSMCVTLFSHALHLRHVLVI